MSRYIEREVLLNDFETYLFNLADEQESISKSARLSSIKWWIDHVKEMPTADVREVVRGEWIKHIDNQYPQESTEECSVCHHHQFLSVMLDNNYCPNCGARMEDKK